MTRREMLQRTGMGMGLVSLATMLRGNMPATMARRMSWPVLPTTSAMTLASRTAGAFVTTAARFGPDALLPPHFHDRPILAVTLAAAVLALALGVAAALSPTLALGAILGLTGGGKDLKVTVAFDDPEVGTKQLLVAVAGLEREWESA